VNAVDIKQTFAWRHFSDQFEDVIWMTGQIFFSDLTLFLFSNFL